MKRFHRVLMTFQTLPNYLPVQLSRKCGLEMAQWSFIDCISFDPEDRSGLFTYLKLNIAFELVMSKLIAKYRNNTWVSVQQKWNGNWERHRGLHGRWEDIGWCIQEKHDVVGYFVIQWVEATWALELNQKLPDFHWRSAIPFKSRSTSLIVSGMNSRPFRLRLKVQSQLLRVTCDR